MALEKPEGFVQRVERAGDRVLQTCGEELSICQAQHGSGDLPLVQWSAMLEGLTADGAGVLDLTRALVDQSMNLDFAASVEQFQDSLSTDEQLAATIASFSEMLESLQALATSEGAVNAAGEVVVASLQELGEFFQHTIDIIVFILQGIANIFIAIFNAIVSVFQIIKNTIWGILTGIGNWLVSWFNSFSQSLQNALDFRIPIDWGCQAQLMQCQYNQFLSNAIPNLLALSFLIGGSVFAEAEP